MIVILQLEKKQVKVWAILLFSIIALLVVLLLTREQTNSNEKWEIISQKDKEITTLQTQLRKESYFGGACKDYLDYIREKKQDLYWENRNTNDFYNYEPTKS